jgi:GT2 family glycosyltransferase
MWLKTRLKPSPKSGSRGLESECRETTSKRVGVVTVTFNSASVVDGFMASMLSQTHLNFVLYIVDNASKDQTISMLSRYSDSRITVVPNESNVGVAEGNNQGIALALSAKCEFVLLINNDTEFGAGLISLMLAAAESRDAEMLVPKIMFFEPKSVIWCAGGFFRPWRGFSTGHYGEGELDRGQFNDARPIEYAPTCCMLIKAAVFGKIGLMDPRYFVYFDDTDFCWRAHEFGIRFWYDPRGMLYHKVSSLTGGSESDFAIKYATRNKVYFALKNLGVLRKTYCLAIYQLVFLAKFLFGRDSKRVYVMKLRAYFRGIRLFLENV